MFFIKIPWFLLQCLWFWTPGFGSTNSLTDFVTNSRAATWLLITVILLRLYSSKLHFGSASSLQTNNTPALRWNHPKFCNMSVSRWKKQGWGFINGWWKPAQARGMPFLRGQTQMLQVKSNWGSPLPQNMKPACAFHPLIHWCWFTEPTEIGRAAGFFLYLKVCTTALLLLLYIHFMKSGPKGSCSPQAQPAECLGKWHIQENGWW